MPKVLKCAVAMFLVSLGVLAQSRVLDFSDAAWEMAGDETRVGELDGRTALQIRMGRAIHREVAFENGTIDFDLRLTAIRSFAFIQFRMASDSDFEEIYFRSHKSGLPDAIQYSPVFRRASQWQLYHAQGSTAAATLPPDEWIHIRIIVDGRRAAVFVGEAAKPQLVVSRLAREPVSGQVALRGFLPQGSPEGVYTTNFANLRVTSKVEPFDSPESSPSAFEQPGFVADWSLSPSYAATEGPVLELPGDAVMSGEWTSVEVEPQGFVAIERHLLRPEGVRRATTLARLRVTAAEAGVRRFDFGYSDEVTVFLNGQPVFSGNDRYSFNFPRRQGLITLDQASLFLPLEEGPNELILAVTDVFGGWGVMGRFVDAQGLTLEAR